MNLLLLLMFFTTIFSLPTEIGDNDHLKESKSLQSSKLTTQVFKRKSGYRSLYPDSIDWQREGAVTPVKNQEDEVTCDDSWAFSATGVIEAHYFSQTGRLVSLSEQNLID